jgi:muramoyltetrapeptide carboxypeptidase
MWAMTATNSGWTVPLQGETFTHGKAEGTLLGGCITLIETSIGTPWELDTRGSILLLEDRGVKPYQLDRMLLHLKQAGKFEGVRGIVLGDFPESDAFNGSDVAVADVCRRVLGPLHIPIVYGAPVGHTTRPMLTMPLGVRAKLTAKGEGRLDILEPAVRA